VATESNIIFDRLMDQLRCSDVFISYLERSHTNEMKFESPIEEMFGTAFVAVAPLRDLRLRIAHGCTLDDLQRISGRHDVAIASQVRVGGMRCDFGIVVWYRGEVVRTILVECDGHEFHERTKAQAKKDKARDRHLQCQGYIVLRFTGSEIWSDAVACASEVCGLVEGDIVGAMFMASINEYAKHSEAGVNV